MLSHFLLLKRLGEGGMGVVFSGYDTRLERKVAIKVLQREVLRSWGSAGRARLLREAQAMARLSHPNVVTVHDAGLFSDEAFIVMDYVEGQTLRAWLQEQPRPWRQVLGVFIQAGRGLAAAHAKGLVHRDFKPDNVLLDVAGRVQVTDFGLVLHSDALAVEAEALRETARPELSVPPGATPPLTRSGTLLGTPGYMAPEQYRPGEVDARADQFAFCVALFEALHGRRPFEGRTREELKSQVLAGRLAPGPLSAQVPARLQAALLTGLQVDPGARHLTMHALLSELERVVAPHRTGTLLTAAAVVAVLAVGGVLQLRAREAEACSGGPSRLAGVWDDPMRKAVLRAFLATGNANAQDLASRVSQRLDSYSSEWLAMHRESCEATTVRKEQSVQLMDLRMGCLERRRDGLAAVSRLLSGPVDGPLLTKSVQVVNGLEALGGCADAEGLRAAYPPPATAGLRTKVADAQAQLDTAQALERAGRFQDARSAVQRVLPEAQRLGHPPLYARALLLAGLVDLGLVAGKDAERSLTEAAHVAGRARDDRLLVRAALGLIRSLQEQTRYAEGRALRPLAEAAVARAGGAPELEAQLLAAFAELERADGRGAEAEALFVKALALYGQAGSADPLAVAQVAGSRASTLRWLGQLERAREALGLAQALTEKAVGPTHPQVAFLQVELATLAEAAGDSAQALVHYERSLAIREVAFGSDTPQAALALANLGVGLKSMGRYAEAKTRFERALAIFEKHLGPEHSDTAWVVGLLAQVARLDKRYAESEQLYAREQAIYAKVHREPTPYLGYSQFQLGLTFVDQQRYGEALRLFEHSLATMEAASGKDSANASIPLLYLGNCLRELGHPARAVPHLERALALRQREKLGATWVEPVRFSLAQSLWAQRATRPRALALAQQAYEALAQSTGAEAVQQRQELATWLRARGHEPGPQRPVATEHP